MNEELSKEKTTGLPYPTTIVLSTFVLWNATQPHISDVNYLPSLFEKSVDPIGHMYQSAKVVFFTVTVHWSLYCYCTLTCGAPCPPSKSLTMTF